MNHQTCKYCNSPEVTKFSSYDYYDVFECNSCNLWFWKSVPDCCRKPQERIVVQQIDSNTFQIRTQCDNCGGCLNMKKPLNHTKYHNQIRGEFSIKNHNNWKQAKTSENEYIFEISKAIRFANSNYAKYLNHLQSPYWKSIRKQVFERDDSLCQSCKVAPAEEVHHLTYINLGNEKIEELISVCCSCHRTIHGNFILNFRNGP